MKKKFTVLLLLIFLWVLNSCSSANEKEKTFDTIMKSVSDVVDSKMRTNYDMNTYYKIYTNNNCPDYSGSESVTNYKVDIYVALVADGFEIWVDYEKSYYNNVVQLSMFRGNYKFECSSSISKSGIPLWSNDIYFTNSCIISNDFSSSKSLYFKYGKVIDISGIGNPPYKDINELTTECEKLVDLGLKKFNSFISPNSLKQIGFENY